MSWSTRNCVLFKLFITQPKPTNHHQQKHRKKKCGSPNTSAPGPVPPLAGLAACISQAPNQVHSFYIYLTPSFFIYLTHFIFIWPARFIFIWPSRQKRIGQFYRFNAFALSREADGPGSQLPRAPAWPNSASSSASAGCCRLRQDLVSWPVQEKPLIFSVCCLPGIFSSHQLRNEVKKAGARAQICKY